MPDPDLTLFSALELANFAFRIQPRVSELIGVKPPGIAKRMAFHCPLDRNDTCRGFDATTVSQQE